MRDQSSMFLDSSPVAAFNGKHSIGPGSKYPVLYETCDACD